MTSLNNLYYALHSYGQMLMAYGMKSLRYFIANCHSISNRAFICVPAHLLLSISIIHPLYIVLIIHRQR